MTDLKNKNGAGHRSRKRNRKESHWPSAKEGVNVI
jgi:hypothetical protein